MATGVSDEYVLPLLVMLSSLRDHLPADAEPILHLLYEDLSDDAFRAVESVIETHAIALPEDIPSPGESPWARVAAAPLFLAEVLPESVDRVLFLDADLLVLDDVRSIFSVDLGGAVVGAAVDGAISTCGSPRGVKDLDRWGVRPTAPYLNAGVLLLDLPAWRAGEVTSRALEYMRDTGARMDQWHQEALNAVVYDVWHRLDDRWNLLGGVAGRRFDRTASEAWRDPGIVHFAGRLKPWRTRVGGRFSGAYEEALEKVRGLVSAPPPTTRERLAGFYDRHLRDVMYPFEKALWERRLH